MTAKSDGGKSDGAFRTIGEVAESLDLPPHVLRFWETRFAEIEPVKRAGGRRYYRPRDVELVAAIRHLLYGRGYTIKGVQRLLREQGVRAVIENSRMVEQEPRGFDFPDPDESEALDHEHREDAPPSREPPPDREPMARMEPASAGPGAALVALQPREPTVLNLSAVRVIETRAPAGLGPREDRRLRDALEDLSESRRMLELTRRR